MARINHRLNKYCGVRNLADTKKTGAEKARVIDVSNFDLDEFRDSFIQRRKTVVKNKLKKRLRVISVFLFISVVGAFFFSLRAVIYYMEFARSQNIQEKAADIANGQTPIKATPYETAIPQETAEPKEIPKPEEIPEEMPLLDKIAGLRREFSNDGIVGYLSIEGTDINYAVAQHTDNEFYLNHDLYGNKNIGGSIFMDYENSVRPFDDNTIIYGHNTIDGSMFYSLKHYMDKQYFESHPFVHLTTPYEETVWEVFSFYKTGIDFYYIQTTFEDEEQFKSFITRIMEKSIHETEARVGANDKILTLSTCDNNSENNRFVLNAKLLTD